MADKGSPSRSSIARMAGNIAAGLVTKYPLEDLYDSNSYIYDDIATQSVELAKRIVRLVDALETI
jgi:hypothetical protein